MDGTTSYEGNVVMTGSFEEVKKYIHVRLVNEERNHEMLADKPHEIMDDLACYYRIEFPTGNRNSIKGMDITESMAGFWGVSQQELHQAALDNMTQERGPVFRSLSEMLGIPDGLMDGPKVYVVTNETGLFGATAILLPEVQEQIHETLGDVYVLPSSVHELLVIGKEGNSVNELRETVQAVNAEEVQLSEQLSDKVYEIVDGSLAEAKENRAQVRNDRAVVAEEHKEYGRKSVRERLSENSAQVKQQEKSNRQREQKHQLDR